MLAGRLCSPCSKLSLHNTQQTYAGFPALKLHDLYKSLDELDHYSDQLNLHLFKRQQQLNGKTVVTFFDVTTLYFESQKANGIKDFGFSKDCKFNEVQVVLSLLINQHGMPIACEVFQGNTYEGHTLVNCISRLKEKYSIDKAIVVADRGLYSNSNLNLINEMGFEYIVGTRLRNSKKSIKEADTILLARRIRDAILEMQRSTLIADGVKFYSYSSLSDLALLALKALDIKVPKSTKIS